jgi:hypothetical protein
MEEKVTFDDDQERVQFRKKIEARNGKVKKMFRESEMVGGVQLKLDYVFGINDRPVSNQLQLVGEGMLGVVFAITLIGFAIFTVSNMIVIKDMNSKTQVFLHRENRFKNVTALAAVSAKKDKIVVAAGESTVEEK